MNILSLFDGMACGMLAFQKAKVPIDNYYAYEIDKFAIKTAKYNFPQIQECGDVFQADFTKYNDIDYLIGGSPCTYWSIAQSPDKRETTASGLGWELFSQYTRALNEAKPKYFIYENNKSMSKAIRASITETFGFEPICINSALVSAQNRQRLYWVGKRNEDGTYSKVDVKQPKDEGILLKGVIGGYDLTSCDKAYCLTATYQGACARNTIERHQRTMVAEPVCIASRGRYVDTNNRSKKTDVPTYQHLEARTDGKTVTLTASSGGPGGKTELYAIPADETQSEAISAADGKTYPIYEVKNGNITLKDKTYPIKLDDGYYIIRKLTISECKRLQTVPNWYEFPVSNTQAYKMLGNGWTVDIIAHLIEATKKDKSNN